MIPGFNIYTELSRLVALTAVFNRDPRVGLLHPGPEAAHSAERFVVQTAQGDVPGVWLTPKAATGAVVVYAHGGGTADILPSAPLFEALLSRGVATVSFDFPGFGAHPAELGYPGSLACLPAVLAFVQREAPTAPTAVYGLSLGADFALAAAGDAPWLRALALFGPPLGLAITESDRLEELLGTFNPLAIPVLWDVPAGHVARTFFVPIRFASGGRHILFEDAFAREIDALIKQLNPLAAARALPPIPTLVLGGGWDAAAPPEDIERLRAAIGPTCEVRIFPHRTHTTLLYDRPAAEWSADWLAARLS